MPLLASIAGFLHARRSSAEREVLPRVRVDPADDLRVDYHTAAARGMALMPDRAKIEKAEADLERLQEALGLAQDALGAIDRVQRSLDRHGSKLRVAAIALAAAGTVLGLVLLIRRRQRQRVRAGRPQNDGDEESG